MRLILLFSAIALAYVATRRLWPEPRRSRMGGEAIIVGAALAIGAMVAAEQLVDASGLGAGHRSLILLLPLFHVDAIIGGAVIGFLLAEQRTAAEWAAWRIPPRPATGSESESAVAAAVGRARGAASNVVLVTLVLIAAFPPATWHFLMSRLQVFKTPAFEIGLGAATGQRLAEALNRTATEQQKPGNQVGSDIMLRGFSTPRLTRMASLTLPADATVFLTNPAALLFQQLPMSDSQAPQVPAVFQIWRDRAYIALLASGQRAASGVLSTEAAQAHARIEPGIRQIGNVQERVLSSLAPDVGCLRHYVAQTHDRRLVQFETRHVARYLVGFARSWSRLEELVLMGWIENQPDEKKMLRVWVKGTVSETVRSGRALVKAFSVLNQDLRSALTGGGYQEEGCGPQNLRNVAMAHILNIMDDLPNILNEQNDRPLNLESFRKAGFSPYLTMFAAHALSGLGNYGAAIELLVNWLDRRHELDSFLDKKLRDRQLLQPQGLLPPNGDRLELELEPIRRALAWYRFQVLSEANWLQSLAESSGDGTGSAAIPSEALLKLILERFGHVFHQIGENGSLSAWRAKSSGAAECREPLQRWRQPLIAAYLSTVVAYLDRRNLNFASPSDFEPRDIELAELLSEVNVECFIEIINNPALRLLQRAVFTNTSVAMQLNSLVESEPRRISRSQADLLSFHLGFLLRRAEQDASDGFARRESEVCGERDREICLLRTQEPIRETRRHINQLRQRLERLRSHSG